MLVSKTTERSTVHFDVLGKNLDNYVLRLCIMDHLLKSSDTVQ